MSKLFIARSATVACILTRHQFKSGIAVWRVCMMLIFVFLIVNLCVGQSPAQLAPPLLKYSSVFFKNSASVELKFAQQGTQIYYTLNNNQPTELDMVYSKPIQIRKSFTTIKAFVSGKGFLPSETVWATFIRDGLKIQSVTQTPPSEKFQGNGLNTLFDNEGGIADTHSKNWLGYQADTVEINITMEKKEKLSYILINFLRDHGSWIFLPEWIRVYYFNDNKGEFELIAEKFNPVNEIVNGAVCHPLIIAASKKIAAGKIKIILNGAKSLPEEHPGKGQHGWIFIDEIKWY